MEDDFRLKKSDAISYLFIRAQYLCGLVNVNVISCQYKHNNNMSERVMSTSISFNLI